MKVTLQFLKKHNACHDGIIEFRTVFGKSADLVNVIDYGIRSKKRMLLKYCNWIIVRKMKYRQRIRYAIYAAEQVIKIYEEKYPDDNRPRKAIQAAKKVLKENNKKNRFTAYTAYTDALAAYAAAATHIAYANNAAAANAAAAAAHAAYAAYAAYNDDANASAANAAYDDATRVNLRIKILEYGLKLCIEKKDKEK